MTTITDTFNRANEIYITLNPWQKVAGGFTGNMSIISNHVEGDGTVGPYMYDGGISWGNDQSSEITAMDANGLCGPMVRCGIGTGYRWHINNGQIQVATAGAFGAAIATRTVAPTLANDTFKLTIIGSTLYCYRTGSLVGATVTDTTYSSGKPGLYTFSAGGRIDSWTGSDVVGPPAPVNLARIYNASPINKSQTQMHDSSVGTIIPAFKRVVVRPT